MGKLAERLADAQRSDIYRVESTEALEEAVAVNGFTLTRIGLAGISSSALCSVAADALSVCVDGHALLFSDFEALVRSDPGALESLMAQLREAAAGRRGKGLHFFAAFLDPSAMLPLAPLYNWNRSSMTIMRSRA